MKTGYIIAFAATALIFAGCGREDITPATGMSDGWLNFRLSGLQLTKGALINSEQEMLDNEINTFKVEAWNADYSGFVTAQTIHYDETASEWLPEDDIAWTGTDSKTFFAYANLPSTGASVTNTFTSSVQKQTLEYTLPLDAREQNDVMLGYYSGNGGGTRTADITLVHPLSSIILKMGEMDIDAIKRITLSGVYASGTVDVTYAAGADGIVPTYDWGDTDTRTGRVDSFLEPAEGEAEINIDPDNNTIGTPFVVIPQTVAANQVMITVTATVGGEEKNLVVKVPAGAFVAGETHVFTLGYTNPSQAHFIDLGLPSGTLWADMNVGAKSVTDPGDYFPWGETTLWYSSISGNTVTMKSDYASFSKTEYNSKSNMKNVNQNLTGENLIYDVAHTTYGSNYHMPSQSDYEELLTNCYWLRVTSYGGQTVTGFIIYKAKADGDKGRTSGTPVASYSESDTHIFMPYSGFITGITRRSGNLNDGPVGMTAGYYATSNSGTVAGTNKSGFVRFSIGTTAPSVSSSFAIIDRYAGMVVRAVKSPAPKPELLPGKFSISATEYVQFSRGNLFCTDKGSGNYEFSFEEKQYDYRCRYGLTGDKAVLGGSVTTTPQYTSGLFQWIPRTSSSATPDRGAFTTYSGVRSDDTFNDVVDFGDVFPDDDWITLTGNQWTYLLGHHTNKFVTVIGVNGLAIAPEDYEGEISASYTTLEQWAAAEADGIVFLPIYGYYNGQNNYVETSESCYWSSSPNSVSVNYATALHFAGTISYVVNERWRIYGQNVRLVHKTEKPEV